MNAPPVLGIDARLANETQRAGVGNFCTEMLRALPAVAASWRLRLYLDRPPGQDFPLAPDQYEARILPPRRFWTHRALGAELRRDPPEVFYSPVMQLPVACPGPTLATVHDLAFRDFTEHFTWRQRSIAGLQARHVARHATHLCADSEATRADLHRLFQIPPDRITVTLAGVSPRFAPLRDPAALAALRAKYGLPERFVLYVGRIQPRKNIVRLLQAFEQTAARCPELPHALVIAGGKGWIYDEIYATAESSPLRDRILFPGFVAEEDLPGLMSAADLLALVSLWEGFGLPVLEAMACGTAVITSNCSSLPEVAGDAAVQVDPYAVDAIAAALRGLLMNDARRATLAAQGMDRAATFTWQAAATRLMDAVAIAASRG